MKPEKIKTEKGNVMAEAMIALSLILIGIVGLVTILNRSLAHTKDISSRLVTSYLAAEGIEIIKNLVDRELVSGSDWQSVLNVFRDGAYEVSYDSNVLVSISPPGICSTSYSDRQLLLSNGVYSYAGGEETSIRRTIRLCSGEGEKFIRANSIVVGESRGQEFEVNLEDRFYDWR